MKGLIENYSKINVTYSDVVRSYLIVMLWVWRGLTFYLNAD